MKRPGYSEAEGYGNGPIGCHFHVATGLWPEEGKIFGTFAYIRSLKPSTCSTSHLISEEDLGQWICKNLLSVGGLCIG